MAREKYANDPKQLAAALADIEALRNVPPIEEVIRKSNELIARMEADRRRSNWLTFGSIAGVLGLIALQTYRYFARLGFSVRSVAILVGVLPVVGLTIWFRDRTGPYVFWSVFGVAAVAGVTWALLY